MASYTNCTELSLIDIVYEAADIVDEFIDVNKVIEGLEKGMWIYDAGINQEKRYVMDFEEDVPLLPEYTGDKLLDVMNVVWISGNRARPHADFLSSYHIECLAQELVCAGWKYVGRKDEASVLSDECMEKLDKIDLAETYGIDPFPVRKLDEINFDGLPTSIHAKKHLG